MAGFLKGVVLGAVVSSVVVVTTSAFAGTGVGSILNLGKTNEVNASTGLSGTVAGRQLNVVNSSDASGASGIGISVHAGRPPLTVNSATKVTNLNADLLDGLDSSKFQRVVTGQCTSGTAISTIAASGAVGCTSAGVIPIYHDMAAGSAGVSDALGGSGLSFVGQCIQNFAGNNISFANSGSSAASLHMLYSTNGSFDSFAASESIPATGTSAFGTGDSEIQGQFILVVTRGAFPDYTRWIVTMNLNETVTANNCEYSGTAEIVPTRYSLVKGK